MSRHRRSTFRRIERNMYLADRTALDIAAFARGPVPGVKRIARRKVTRAVFRLFR